MTCIPTHRRFKIWKVIANAGKMKPGAGQTSTCIGQAELIELT